MSDTSAITAPDDSIEAQVDAWIEGSLTSLGDAPANQEEADRLLWALRSARRRHAEAEAVIRSRKEQLDTWLRQQTDQHEARERQLLAMLAGWTHAQADATGRQTFQLPAGTLQTRALRQRSEVDARMTAAEAVAHVAALVAAAMLSDEAVKVERTVRPGVVKEATRPGDVIPDYPDTPDGYAAHEAVGSFDMGGPEHVERVVPGVVLFVALPGRAGRKFEAKT